MANPFTKNQYDIEGLTFDGFAELCEFLKELKPEIEQINYTILGERGAIATRETERARVNELLENSRDSVKRMTANFVERSRGTRMPTGSTKIQYRPIEYDGRPKGLELQSNALSRVILFEFENHISSRFSTDDPGNLQFEYGEPCEVLVADMDMRGFTTFSEQAHIESPYICALMSAFYQLATKSFSKFPADITKFAGDGILSIWRTAPQERHIAVQSVIKGIANINKQWKVVRENPHFTHGAPDLIGTSLAFGQASKMKVQIGIDFIGRPINLAARLCGSAPGDKLIIDKSVPDLPRDLKLEDYEVEIKSFGSYQTYIMDCLET